ncbi:MAG: DUF2834 domain-containing protein [Polyangiaceae bacterium]|nr:DUF2834 domain-containing protein [Polyangiaceae bacterium]
MIYVYAVLAVIGAVGPWYFNVQWMALGNTSLFSFLSGVFANPASSSIGVDIVVGATAVNLWMVHEAKRIGMKHVWVYIVVTFFVAFACAAPLFMLMRERHLRATRG